MGYHLFENIMEPFNRLTAIGKRCIPGINGIGFTIYKTPVDSAYFSFFNKVRM